ncbi:MAG: hypothetical protein WKF84_25190 [Pyrinomonadaceae bacterium]
MSTVTRKEKKLERPARGGLVTFVEAVRQGIWEEMERDPTVFVIGEDVGVYGGAFKVTEGLHRRVRKGSRHRHSDFRGRNCRRSLRRGADGHAPHC